MPKRYKIIICMKTVVNAVNFIPKDSKCFFLKFAICIGKLWACANTTKQTNVTDSKV